ncbi:esterase [Cutibacterium acnes JCM 18916]|nr:esterase [Cutibacterium acnes JCM 18916]
MTQSLSDPHGHYYRRLFTDAFRCLQAAREMELVDPTRIAVLGHSQGGGQAIAVCALAAMRGIKLAGAFVDVPFLCHIRRSCDIATDGPYLEVVRYLAAHRHCAAVLSRLSGISTACISPVGPELLPGFQSR